MPGARPLVLCRDRLRILVGIRECQVRWRAVTRNNRTAPPILIVGVIVRIRRGRDGLVVELVRTAGAARTVPMIDCHTSQCELAALIRTDWFVCAVDLIRNAWCELMAMRKRDRRHR